MQAQMPDNFRRNRLPWRVFDYV